MRSEGFLITYSCYEWGFSDYLQLLWGIRVFWLLTGVMRGLRIFWLLIAVMRDVRVFWLLTAVMRVLRIFWLLIAVMRAVRVFWLLTAVMRGVRVFWLLTAVMKWGLSDYLLLLWGVWGLSNKSSARAWCDDQSSIPHCHRNGLHLKRQQDPLNTEKHGHKWQKNIDWTYWMNGLSEWISKIVNGLQKCEAE